MNRSSGFAIGLYRSPMMWEAASDLAAGAWCSCFIGIHERELRKISDRRARLLFTNGLYKIAPEWGSCVRCAMDAIAKKYGWKDRTSMSHWRVLSDWLGLDHENDERAKAAWAVRQAQKWRDGHPGTRVVAISAEWDGATRSSFASWMQMAVSP